MIGGTGVANGYFKRADLTAERFAVRAGEQSGGVEELDAGLAAYDGKALVNSVTGVPYPLVIGPLASTG